MVLSGLGRAWITFSVVCFSVAVVASIFDGVNPFTCDDPHVVSFTAGIVVAGIAFVQQLINARRESSSRAAFTGVVFTCVVVAIAWDGLGPDHGGQGMATMLGVAVLLGGLVGYRMQRVPLTPAFVGKWSVPAAVWLVAFLWSQR